MVKKQFLTWFVLTIITLTSLILSIEQYLNVLIIFSPILFFTFLFFTGNINTFSDSVPFTIITILLFFFLLYSSIDKFYYYIEIFILSLISTLYVLRRKFNSKDNFLKLLSDKTYIPLIENSLSGVFIYQNEKILYVNSKLYDILGYKVNTMNNMPLWNIICPEDHENVKELIKKRNMDEEHVFYYEIRLVKANGSIFWAEVLSSKVYYNQKPYILVNVHDITDRKDAERKTKEMLEITKMQEEQLVHSARLAELGEMAAAIAHELNQPLTGIKNYSKNSIYMIENKLGGAEDIKNNLEQISKQVDRASKIINQMRELTRKTDKVFTLVEINVLLQECLDFLTSQLRMIDVKLKLNLDDKLPKIMGDKIRLEQVFLNLLTNAIQAVKEVDERKIEVVSYLKESSIYIEIMDTGKGFGPEIHNKLFAPFFSTKKPGHGTGLGLSISLAIIKEHGGIINAYGKQGEGAKFVVIIPTKNPELIESIDNRGVQYEQIIKESEILEFDISYNR